MPPTARVLILTGGASAKKNGTLDEVKAALGPRVVQEFGGIEPNPTYETLMLAVELVRRERPDFLLAVADRSSTAPSSSPPRLASMATPGIFY